MKKSMITKLMVVVVMFTMVFSMTGCEATKTVEFVKQVTEISEALTTEQTSFEGKIQPFIQAPDDTARQEILDSIAKMDEQYAKLSKVEVPKKYSSIEGDLTSACSKAQEALAIYKEQFTAYTEATEESLTTFVEEATKGDNLMVEVQTLMQSVASKLTEADK